MTAVEQFMTESKTEQKTDRQWLTRLWPMIWAAAGAIAVLILKPADQILPHTATIAK